MPFRVIYSELCSVCAGSAEPRRALTKTVVAPRRSAVSHRTLRCHLPELEVLKPLREAFKHLNLAKYTIASSNCVNREK